MYSGFLQQLNWPPRYNWNIVEIGVKHTNPNKSELFFVDFIWQAKKEILDTELELFNKQQCGEDTIVLRKKLNELTKQVQHYCESMLCYK